MSDALYYQAKNRVQHDIPAPVTRKPGRQPPYDRQSSPLDYHISFEKNHLSDFKLPQKETDCYITQQRQAAAAQGRPQGPSGRKRANPIPRLPPWGSNTQATSHTFTNIPAPLQGAAVVRAVHKSVVIRGPNGVSHSEAMARVIGRGNQRTWAE